MKNKFVVVVNFRNNQPKMKEACLTEEAASATVLSCLRKFAGIVSIAIYNPKRDKICFDSMGNYLLTIPSETCKKLKLRP